KTSGGQRGMALVHDGRSHFSLSPRRAKAAADESAIRRTGDIFPVRAIPRPLAFNWPDLRNNCPCERSQANQLDRSSCSPKEAEPDRKSEGSSDYGSGSIAAREVSQG